MRVFRVAAILSMSVNILAGCDETVSEGVCLLAGGKRAACSNQYTRPADTYPKRPYYEKDCYDKSELVPNVEINIMILIEPLEWAGMTCYYFDRINDKAKGHVEHHLTDEGFSFTMPCQPEWTGTDGQTAIVQFDGEDAATVKIMDKDNILEAESESSCTTEDTR